MLGAPNDDNYEEQGEVYIFVQYLNEKYYFQLQSWPLFSAIFTFQTEQIVFLINLKI